MVDRYVDGVTSLDVHGPDFRKKVDDIRNDGRRGHPRVGVRVQHAARQAAGVDRREGGLTETSTVSQSLLDLRHTVEDLDPAHQGDLFSPKKLLGRAAVRRRRPDPRLLRQVPLEPDAPQQDHRVAVLGPGRAASRQRGDRRRAAAAVGDQRPAAPVHLHGPAARREARRADRGDRGDRSRAGDRASSRTCCSTSARRSRTSPRSWRSACRATSRSTSCARTTSS